MRTILFVCTGNTCRSPMGEAWLSDYLKKIDKEKNFYVHSCGIYAVEGMQISKGSQQRLQQEGIDASSHNAKPITSQMIKEADLIFCMSHSHQAHIVSIAPQATKKVVVLNVDDPVGFGNQVYDRCFREIVSGLQAHMGRILEG